MNLETKDEAASEKDQMGFQREDELYLREYRLKAETLRARKKKRLAVLSGAKAVSTLLLFISFGLYQFGLLPYLSSVILGCIILGLSTYMERET